MRIASSQMNLLRASKGILLYAAAIAACLCPTPVFGQTNSTWNGGTGNWSNATDWTPNTIPNNGGGNTYNVTIDSGGTDAVTLDQNATINSLVLDGTYSSLTTLPGAAETLNITGSLTLGPEFSGGIQFNNGSSLIVGGNVTVGTPESCCSTVFTIAGGSSFVASGTFTNYAGVATTGGGNSFTVLGQFVDQGGLSIGSGDVAKLGSLVNDYAVSIASGATLNLTNEPNGITDIAAGSAYGIGGTFTAGSKNALGSLNSVEGSLFFSAGQTTNTITPSSGTLTLTQTSGCGLCMGELDVEHTTLTISGNVSNSGNLTMWTGGVLNATGTFTNQSNGHVQPDDSGDGGGVLNLAALVNYGSVIVPNALDVSGALMNYGTISMGGNELTIGPSSVNDGSIEMQYFSGCQASTIEGAAASDVLTNEKTILGGGNIGNGSMGLVNSKTGMVVADCTKTPLIVEVSSAGFQNNGTVEVRKGDELIITGAANSFLNFKNSTNTLTGGTYIVDGTLKFDNANIVTNAANITLFGTASAILNNLNGNNALANFATNASAGSFTLSGDRNFTTAGAFSNAGKLTISKGSTFTVGSTNNFKQTAGTTTVSGTLAVAPPGGVNVSGGSVFGIGTITGNIDLTGGLLSPGAASKKAGELTVSGTYAQSGAGAFDVDLGGTAVGTQYDVLDITSTATLGGVLNVDLIGGFTPTVGDTFDIMDYTSETGTFTTVNLPKLSGGDTWSISYNATDVVLTVDSPAATEKGAVSASPTMRSSRGFTAGASSTQEPMAILSRVTCYGAGLRGLTSCAGAIAGGMSRGELRQLASERASSGARHNNVMVVTRSISSGRGGASLATSSSATSMAWLYVCAYLPSSVAHTMGCN